MRPLDIKLLRDLKRVWSQALAIALVIGCGVATLVGFMGTSTSLEATRDAYYDRYRFADVFAPVKRAPERVKDRVEALPGVAAVETRIIKEVILDLDGLDAPATARLVSLPETGEPRLNAVYLKRGRLLDGARDNEVLVDVAFAEAHGFKPGDQFEAILNGRKRALTVVGIALSPEYIFAMKPGEIMPDNHHFGILYMTRESLAAAFGFEGAFNDLSLSLERGTTPDAVIESLDRLLAAYGATGAYKRKDHQSHAFLKGEMDGLDAMIKIVPPIFLGVAAFLLNLVVTRMVETEREQIGLLKAFGYSAIDVAWHYGKFIAYITLIGIALGFLSGAWLGDGLTELYGRFYRFPFLHYGLDPQAFILAGLVSFTAAGMGALRAVKMAFTLPPAEAMQPAPPPTYKRSLLENLGLSEFFAQPTRMILRHIRRWPLRAGMTGLGIACAVAILVEAFFFSDSTNHLADVHFNMTNRQDVTLSFVDKKPLKVLNEISHLPGVLAAEPFRSVPTKISFKHRSRRVGLEGRQIDAQISRLLDPALQSIHLPQDGLVLTAQLAKMLGAYRGDFLTIEVLEGRRPVLHLPVAAVVEEFVGFAAYMNIEALNRALSEGNTISGAHLMIDDQQEAALYKALKETPAVAGVALRRSALESFEKTMVENITIANTFYLMFAGLIAIGVVYNAARISLSERGRELATLRVLGFSRFEVSYILLGELMLVTFLAIPVGLTMGYGLAWLTTKAFDVELYRIPLVLEISTYGAAAIIVCGAALLSGLVVRRRIDRLDLVAVLKTRE